MTKMDSASEGRACPYFDAFNPTEDGQIADPFSTWSLARREMPVFFSPVLNAFVVTRYEHVSDVLMDTATFSSNDVLMPPRPNPQEVQEILASGLDASKLGAMIMLDDPVHAIVRRAMAAAFTPRRVALLEEEVRSVTNTLIDAMTAEGPEAEFVSAFAYLLPLKIITSLLGVPWDDAEQLHEWAAVKLALQFGEMPLDQHIRVAHSFVEFQRYARALIDERRSAPKDDLISVMLAFESEEGNPLDEVVLAGQVMGLINAGHETVTNMLTMGLFHLLEDRSQWEALQSNPELASRVVDEALRFDGPVKMLFRRATHETEIGGYAIPAGGRVAIVLGSGNRDEAAFVAAERFDITADRAKQHLAFGRGAHYCLGASLARAEGRIAFSRLSSRLPSLRLIPQELEFERNVVVRMPRALYVEWD